MRDVAYLCVSSLDEDVLQQQEQQLLQHYHGELLQQLHAAGKERAAEVYTYDVMLSHFDLCVVDYVRFMAGWGMWGNVQWAKQRTQQVLRQLPAVVKVARSVW